MDTKFPLLFAALLLGCWTATGYGNEQDHRQNAREAYDQGNYNDAYEGYRKLALDPQTEPTKIGEDLKRATDCLKQLGRLDELDSLWEQAVQTHENNWRLLFAVAQSYSQAEHYGVIVAGEFHRGHHRGGGRYVYVFERDRIRALQLMTQAMENTEDEEEVRDLS
ncbi:MAG: hypothetical protein O7E52_22835, partial [Candidatus Poribacteria bacterium]|nr:hypothetical protein [Candidatus Poribacteria bacterium]